MEERAALRGGTLAILRAKERRLLARDPRLPAQTSQQVAAVLPLGLVLLAPVPGGLLKFGRANRTAGTAPRR